MAEGRGLASYILTRLILAVPTVLILLTIVFLIMRVAPGDPAQAMLGAKAPPSQLELLREHMGLNKPLYMQYIDYIFGVVQGDLGKSFQFNTPMWELIKPRLMATLELVLYGFTLAVGLGVLLGKESAKREGSWGDFLGDLYGIAIYAFPIFWVGIMAQLIFGIELGWLPTSGRFGAMAPPQTITGLYTIDSLLQGQIDKFIVAIKHLILPATVLGVYISGIFTRITRTNMLQTLKEDYIEAAEARGIKEKLVVNRYALKNALLPLITIMGLQFALTLAGAVLTEVTFNWPGMADFIVSMAIERDYPAVQATVTVFAILVASVSVLIDIVIGVLDPRIRF
ncbi:MAG: ABC-type dipeptide/oligopeptide/nickel transport system, permease component [Candidatus Methanohalarchaeum thermophilum]|uniref:ABC-type dipeptide/oligopeptide/nickel transport system, permease component n=1 Tax=Methanohalarchaeum thermophilum TaxID=1903181 RepID=A0A1Q6DT47_METT1|nr:MAG: ABC-type dipeptide/oligopeptide/nickel transport system, permease component [Candidatus Methanohalarchaeum thermophilum]